jgi:hypothetical protein
VSVVVTPNNADTAEPYVHVNVNTAEPAHPTPTAYATVSRRAVSGVTRGCNVAATASLDHLFRQ